MKKFGVLDLINFYFKNIIFNFVILIIVFLIGLIYIFYVHEEEYVASVTFMMGVCFEGCVEEANLNVDFNKKVLYDYIELIKSNKVLKSANEASKLKYSTGDLRKMVDVAYEEDTEYIRITIVSNDQDDSAKLAYNLFISLENEIKRIFDMNNIHLVDRDEVGYLKVSEKKLIFDDFVVAFIISVVVSIIEFLFSPFRKIKKFIKKILPKKGFKFNKKEIVKQIADDTKKNDKVVVKKKATSSKTKKVTDTKDNTVVSKKTTGAKGKSTKKTDTKK